MVQVLDSKTLQNLGRRIGVLQQRFQEALKSAVMELEAGAACPHSLHASNERCHLQAHVSMTLASTTEVLAKRIFRYYKISMCMIP